MERRRKENAALACHLTAGAMRVQNNAAPAETLMMMMVIMAIMAIMAMIPSTPSSL
jgi:hypothetical protein